MSAVIDVAAYPGLELSDLERTFPDLIGKRALWTHYRLVDETGSNPWGEDHSPYCDELAIRWALETWETGWFGWLALVKVPYRGAPVAGDLVWRSDALPRPAGVSRELAARRVAKRLIRSTCLWTEHGWGREAVLDHLNKSQMGSMSCEACAKVSDWHVIVSELANIPVAYRFKLRELAEEIWLEAAGVPGEQLSLF